MAGRGEEREGWADGESGKKEGEKKKAGQKEGCNTRNSQEVTHPSTALAQARLTAEF